MYPRQILTPADQVHTGIMKMCHSYNTNYTDGEIEGEIESVKSNMETPRKLVYSHSPRLMSRVITQTALRLP
jgi:hypothetical protein